jgi:hypothetical protein
MYNEQCCNVCLLKAADALCITRVYIIRGTALRGWQMYKKNADAKKQQLGALGGALTPSRRCRSGLVETQVVYKCHRKSIKARQMHQRPHHENATRAVEQV